MERLLEVRISATRYSPSPPCILQVNAPDHFVLSEEHGSTYLDLGILNHLGKSGGSRWGQDG